MNPLLSLGFAIGRNAVLGRPPGSSLPSSPETFGIPVKDPRSKVRIAGILDAFFRGFEGGLRKPREVFRLAGTVPELLHPFFHEGAAMGIAGRLTFSGKGLDAFAERAAAREGDGFLFLKHVGLGFWLGFRHPSRPDRAEAAARRIGKYGDLVLDGYGFKAGFFDCRRGLESARRLLGTAGPSSLSPAGVRNAAFGVGRSRWFFHMDDPESAFREAREFGERSPEVLEGLGLASAFTLTDDLARAYSAADSLEGDERNRFVKGIRVALYVRDVDTPGLLEENLLRLPGKTADRAREDLALALRVGAATREREEFLSLFHKGCLEG